VRKFLSPEEDLRLSREHDALQKRVETESDEVAKLRLSSALAALEQQRDQRLELARSAARFEAEHTRISYTLESLYTQIVRMRSADPPRWTSLAPACGAASTAEPGGQRWRNALEGEPRRGRRREAGGRGPGGRTRAPRLPRRASARRA